MFCPSCLINIYGYSASVGFPPPPLASPLPLSQAPSPLTSPLSCPTPFCMNYQPPTHAFSLKLS